ncbi:hypothetical protein ACQR3V_11100 [Rhodococcus erythropolis]|uniref:hypothetical protein n=1 Tax=Rhodococcus erythropolis TaxID=1833 RepID=UPI003D14A9AE
MTTHIAVSRKRSKAPARRCITAKCAELTRHRSQRCPDHRNGGSSANALDRADAYEDR